MNILEMGKEELLSLKVEDINRPLTAEEVEHMAVVLGAFWQYDYEAAKQGRVGMHALLKSERHSDGFFVSRILLALANIRWIIAQQIVTKLCNAGVLRPDIVAGIPDGATKLGEDVAEILGAKNAEMVKVDGRIALATGIIGRRILLVEDFCTRGTGFTEAAKVIKAQPGVYLLPFNPVIINRGGLKEIIIEGIGKFDVLPVVERRVQDWTAEECPLCQMGSKPIKPKATDENWLAITTSQL